MVYLTLLRHGTQTTSLIAQRAELNRGTTFLALKELVKRGLVTKIVKEGIQYHSAVSPRYLNSLLLRKQEEMAELEAELQQGLPLLESLANPTLPRPKISFFEGQEGLRSLLEDTLTAKDKKLFGILSMEDLYEVFGEAHFENYVKRRIERGFSLRVLRNKAKDILERWPSSEQDHRELRYLPAQMVFPATMYIYDGKVSFMPSKKEGFGLLIESPEIYQIQLNLFETLWGSGSALSTTVL